MQINGNELHSTLNVESFLKLDMKMSFFEPDASADVEMEEGDSNVCKIITDVIRNAVNN
jgi:hypothetical protein|tara:strand:+ start:365 stop:541 length:177 start_codon:yes stop_codon:yes gene_type:complete